MTELDEILKERCSTHGEYTENARVEVEIMKVLETGANPPRSLHVCMEVSERMIAHKLARITGGDPYEPDHWDDIAGYAKLVADRIRDGRIHRPVPIDELIRSSESEVGFNTTGEHPLVLGDPVYVTGDPRKWIIQGFVFDGVNDMALVKHLNERKMVSLKSLVYAREARLVPRSVEPVIGTPEDGGQHVRYVPEVKRQPIRATDIEYKFLQGITIEAGSMEGHQWRDIYARVVDPSDSRWVMLPEHQEEYGE